MEKWTDLTWEEINALPFDEFDKMAKNQCVVFPDLLKITDEEDIIETFYRQYQRKRVL